MSVFNFSARIHGAVVCAKRKTLSSCSLKNNKPVSKSLKYKEIKAEIP